MRGTESNTCREQLPRERKTMCNGKGNNMCRSKIALSVLLLGLLTLATPKATADTCPDGAVSTGVGLVLTAFRVNSAEALVRIGPGGVGICETIFLQGSLSYVPFDSQGNIVAAFEGGQAVIETGLSNPSFSQVVTPDGGVPKIGPIPSTCTPPAVGSLVATKVAKYTINPADIVAGQVQFFIVYSGGNAHIGSDLIGVESATTAINVRVSTGPSCSILPATQTVCAGATATFTVSATGQAPPFTFTWTGPGGFTATGATITINNAQAANAGTYTAKVTDAFGCTSTCTAILVVTPNPTCAITGDTPVCAGTTHTYTSTVLPAGGTVTHSWSISGSGTINGSTTGASVSVTAGASGSFTLTDNVTRDGCPGQCTLTVPINPTPTCSITGDSPVCTGTTHTYTSAVSPAGGTVTHSWSISGNGTINGSTTGASVSVTAGAAGSFTLTDNITRDGCPGQCTLTVTVIPCKPSIEVFKQVVCVGSDGKCQSFSDDLTAQSSASGVKGATCPAFCYRITVRNSSPDVPLVNVTVRDPDLNLSGCSFATSLTPGQSTSCIIPNVERCADLVNTVTARGVSAFDSTQSATATDTATVTVVPISVACDITLFSQFDDDNNPNDNHVTLTASGPVDFSLTVHNTGKADLSVAIVGLPCSVDLDGNPIPTTVTVPAGGSTNFVCSVEVECPQGTNITVTVTGTAVASTSVPCVFDVNGKAVTTAPSSCTDSVSCACLGCCDPATGAFIPPTVGPLIHKFALCNPDDHKVCGPEPRPAPANAIIFSGVGKLTPTSDNGVDASRAEWVVFRAYIEDRSEPGGFHPKGAVEPADIYCFQAWKTGIRASKKPDFSTVSPDFRTALGQANCDFLAALENGALPIGTLPPPVVNGLTADIQDCGPLHDGNQQIHPSTAATCNQ